MILAWLIALPLAGGLLSWLTGKWSPKGARIVALLVTLTSLVLCVGLWAGLVPTETEGRWQLEIRAEWIPALGTSFHLALDGLSLLMVVLTAFVGLLSVVISWSEIQDRVGLFHACLLWILAGIYGVFLSLDLFLFYVFWEVMLVPMYFLIGIWGHARRIYAAVKFFIYTQACSLLMLLAILAIFFIRGDQTGIHSFDYLHLLGTSLPPGTAMLILAGFFVGFGVKLPVLPLHGWLPDAHGEAPTAGSLILAGLLLKTGAYGLIRFALPLVPQAAERFAPVAMVLAVVGILYGAMLAFAQTDLKRMVAYTSVSHMGFVLLGIFAWNQLALQGAVMQMICHAVSTGALFMLAGMLLERLHSRDIRKMGGLWSQAPRMGGVAMVFALASLGLPGLGNFVAEFLVLFGSFQGAVTLTTLATVGLVFATVYSLWMIQKVFHGPATAGIQLADLGKREMVSLAVMMAVIVWLGLYPQPVLDTTRTALANLQSTTHQTGGGR